METVAIMSDFCFTNDFPEDSNCMPDHPHRNGTKALVFKFVGVYCIFNAALGLSANLLTLVAIPFAAYKNKLVFFI